MVDLEQVAQAADDNKVIRLLNLVLLQAIKDKASDIHFEPFENEFKMRYRIDGVLYEMVPPPPHLALPIVSRVKVMANLDIAERRLPQDGRIELTVNQLPIDLRVSVLPTMYGESVVMRVLDRSNVQLSLDKVGLRDDDLEHDVRSDQEAQWRGAHHRSHRFGQDDDALRALAELNDPDTKILTAEDPVEYDIDGLIQCQVNTEQDLTFARLLRSFLRQDPDTILVGEIRRPRDRADRDPGVLDRSPGLLDPAYQRRAETILRLVDLGVETFLITATIEAIVAQRLVRRICDKCKEEYEPSEEELMELELRPPKWPVARSSVVTDATIATAPAIGPDGDVRDHGSRRRSPGNDRRPDIDCRSSSTECRRRGMRTLRETGLLSIYDGRTTIDEVVRETIDCRGVALQRVENHADFSARSLVDATPASHNGPIEAGSAEEAIQADPWSGAFPRRLSVSRRARIRDQAGHAVPIREKKKKKSFLSLRVRQEEEGR